MTENTKQRFRGRRRFARSEKSRLFPTGTAGSLRQNQRRRRIYAAAIFPLFIKGKDRIRILTGEIF